jgi:thiol:disulfide interchange protein DsbA
MKRLLCLAIFVFLGHTAWAATSTEPEPVFVEGVDYQVLSQQAQAAVPKTKGVVTVTEFFSYGCPWCYKIEPDLKEWRRKLPRMVAFSRVPVIFERGWDVYAKAYYAASILRIANIMTPAIFKAIHDDSEKLETSDAMIKFFIKMGVKENIAKSAFLSSPTVVAKVKAGMQLMQIFRVQSVPSLVINNKYRLDIGMMKGDTSKFFKVAGVLVAREIVREQLT